MLGTYSSAIDALYTYAQVPEELRETGIVAGANDPWTACQPVILLLEVLRQRFVQDEHATPYLRMLTKKGDLPAVVQRTGNMAIDVTGQVHPDIAEQMALAARVVGLDIAGIDLVVEDISKPLAPQGGAIVEVNAGPGLLMHIKPADGEPRPVHHRAADRAARRHAAMDP